MAYTAPEGLSPNTTIYRSWTWPHFSLIRQRHLFFAEVSHEGLLEGTPMDLDSLMDSGMAEMLEHAVNKYSCILVRQWTISHHSSTST
ncbi:hypothetical protein CXB37_14950 [Pseudomonas syringae pv. syringae]|nr:hypothetical protein CXB37_14950 [Pseudomonas syringae pv. syringae]